MTTRLIEHTMCGNDAPWLGQGFCEWEEDSRARWAGQVFSLKLKSPARPAPYVCALSLKCWVPHRPFDSALDVYANRVRVARLADAYGAAAKGEDLRADFWTFGGDLEITCAFERPYPPHNARDRRQLSAVVLSFSLDEAV